MTWVRYVVEWDVPAFEAAGWVVDSFYGWRGPCAVFLMTKEIDR
jgi:hypothetical protein